MLLEKRHFMVIKGTIYQEAKTMISIYAHSRDQNTWSKNWLSGEIDNSTIVGDFNTHLSIMGIMIRQKINKKIQELTMGYTNKTSQALRNYSKEYAFLWRTYVTFSRIDPMLGHNISLNKSEEAEIIQSLFFKHNKWN